MKPETEDDWRERIECAKRLVESRLDEDIDLEELAAAAHASIFHFHRIFRGLTGETVRTYSRRLRLELAAHRLTRGDEDILKLALECGYDSHEAFARAFKRHFGTTPSSYRAEHAMSAPLPGDPCMSTPIHVRIENQKSKHIAFVRHVGPYHQVGEAWSVLMKWGWSKMLFGRVETFGLCYDDPEVTPSDKIRYEACMTCQRRECIAPSEAG